MNGIHCNVCDTTIISEHRHDFKWCNCPVTDDPATDTRVAVDGGDAYRRRCFNKLSDWTELEDSSIEKDDWTQLELFDER